MVNNTKIFKIKKSVICVALASAILCTSCLGSFSAFNNLKDWNQNVSDSKFVNNLIFWGLNIVPVYGLFFFGDTVIFNVIEFWSGSNPIAMNEGESEIQVVEKEGNTFKMIATKNRLQIAIIEGYRKGEKLDLVYSPSYKSWSAIKADGTIIKLASFEEGFYVVYFPNGEKLQLNPFQTRAENLELLSDKIVLASSCDIALR